MEVQNTLDMKISCACDQKWRDGNFHKLLISDILPNHNPLNGLKSASEFIIKFMGDARASNKDKGNGLGYILALKGRIRGSGLADKRRLSNRY